MARRVVDDLMRRYYDRRAREYDDWWLGGGLFAERQRPGWSEEVGELVSLIRGLPPARTLDVACGTGFLTRQLSGEAVGLDQSESMVAVASERILHEPLLRPPAAGRARALRRGGAPRGRPAAG